MRWTDQAQSQRRKVFTGTSGCVVSRIVGFLHGARCSVFHSIPHSPPRCMPVVVQLLSTNVQMTAGRNRPQRTDHQLLCTSSAVQGVLRVCTAIRETEGFGVTAKEIAPQQELLTVAVLWRIHPVSRKADKHCKREGPVSKESSPTTMASHECDSYPHKPEDAGEMRSNRGRLDKTVFRKNCLRTALGLETCPRPRTMGTARREGSSHQRVGRTASSKGKWRVGLAPSTSSRSRDCRVTESQIVATSMRREALGGTCSAMCRLQQIHMRSDGCCIFSESDCELAVWQVIGAVLRCWSAAWKLWLNMTQAWGVLHRIWWGIFHRLHCKCTAVAITPAWHEPA